MLFPRAVEGCLPLQWPSLLMMTMYTGRGQQIVLCVWTLWQQTALLCWTWATSHHKAAKLRGNFNENSWVPLCRMPHQILWAHSCHICVTCEPLDSVTLFYSRSLMIPSVDLSLFGFQMLVFENWTWLNLAKFRALPLHSWNDIHWACWLSVTPVGYCLLHL